MFISSINLYVFRAYLQPIIRRFTVYVQQLVRVVLFRWQSSKKHNTYQLMCIYSIPPDDGLQLCPKHVDVGWRNKHRINSASSWFLLHRYIEMHGQQNIKQASVPWMLTVKAVGLVRTRLVCVCVRARLACLTRYSMVLLEKLVVPQLAKQFLAF